MRRRGRRARGGRGFALAEALVAVAVAATALAGFYGALATAAQLKVAAGKQAARVSLAAGLLDRVGADWPLRPGFAESGEADGLPWSVRIADGVPGDLQTGMGIAGLVTVYVSVGEGEAPVTLRALRYAASPL